MSTRKITRRQAITTASAGAVGAMINLKTGTFETGKISDKLALQGGTPVRTAKWPVWPVWNESAEKGIIEMLRTGRWWRGSGEHVIDFEKKYAELIGAKRCLATASGTTALMVALQALGVDAGDEVLVSPYTFIASYNVIFMHKALPVFVDSDPETFLLNPAKIQERITDRTTAMIPVHIYGLPVDMDSVNAVAKKHNIKVVEDACQAWLAEYKGRKVGTFGDAGCFSFQNSKNLPAGEGGAIVSNNEELMDLCNTLHNCGRPFGSVKRTSDYPINGGNNRMQQIQALILMSQMDRILADADVRLANAQYLDKELAKIPGIVPYKLAPGAERSAYHLYPFRYIREKFNNAPKAKFLEALRAEGIPGSSGYGPQNHEGLIENALNSRGYKRLFSEARLKRWREENVLPGNDLLCSQAVTFTQNILLGSRSDMEDIVKAIAKIYENRGQLS
ncbi:MAG TPA: DegT/DnrJ/EryC1/StrS family aminotransferase [Bacteroidales bacterium]|jgi:dTDP-4-amino-4,6-dideoxygalactose transaminase|nr:DegT/DnrJ/EryC1/StrS family aminotransferase [Bacteroidales bacterium]